MWVMLLLAGLTALWFGTRQIMIQYRLQREGTRVRGLVVRHRAQSGKGGPVYFAVVEFVDAQGSRHTFEAGASGVKGLPIGGEVPVRYLPGVPKGARFDLAGRRVWEIAFPIALGTVFMGGGIWMLATGR